MASLAIDSITRNPSGTWTFAWTDGSLLPVYLRGDYLGDYTDTYTTPEASEVPPDIEVGTDSTTRYLAPWIEVTWRGAPPSTLYTVEQKIGDDWVFVADVVEDGRGFYSYKLQAEAGDVYELRVVSDFADWPDSTVVITVYTPTLVPELDVWYDDDTNEVVIEELV